MQRRNTIFFAMCTVKLAHSFVAMGVSKTDCTLVILESEKRTQYSDGTSKINLYVLRKRCNNSCQTSLQTTIAEPQKKIALFSLAEQRALLLHTFLPLNGSLYSVATSMKMMRSRQSAVIVHEKPCALEISISTFVLWIRVSDVMLVTLAVSTNSGNSTPPCGHHSSWEGAHPLSLSATFC